MTAYAKQPQNPFSARGHDLPISPGPSSRRMITLFCSSLTFAFLVLLLSSDSMAPEIAEAERRVGGLRSHFKFLPQALVSLSPQDDKSISQPDENTEWVNKMDHINKSSLHDDDSMQQDDDEEDELVLDPEYQVTKNKRIGETKAMVKQEHQELHASVQNHVFGQENVEKTNTRSVRRQSFDEIMPVVVSLNKVEAAAAMEAQTGNVEDAGNEVGKNEPMVIELSENKHSASVEEEGDNEENSELSAILQKEAIVADYEHSESTEEDSDNDKEVKSSPISKQEPVIDAVLDADSSATE